MISVAKRVEVSFNTNIPLLALEIALSLCHLKLSFSSSIIARCF